MAWIAYMGRGFGCAFSGTVERHCWPNGLLPSQCRMEYLREKGAIGRRVVDPNVLVEGIEWVSGTILLCPVDLLPCGAGLCVWECKHLGV